MRLNTQNRECLTVENDDDASRGEDLRLSSCNLLLLPAGDVLLERVVTRATNGSDGDTDADDDGASYVLSRTRLPFYRIGGMRGARCRRRVG